MKKIVPAAIAALAIGSTTAASADNTGVPMFSNAVAVAKEAPFILQGPVAVAMLPFTALQQILTGK